MLFTPCSWHMFSCSSTVTMRRLSLLSDSDVNIFVVARFNKLYRRRFRRVYFVDDSLNAQKQYIAYKLGSISKLNRRNKLNLPSTKFSRQQVRSKIAVTRFFAASVDFGLFPRIKYIYIQIYYFMIFLPGFSVSFSILKYFFWPECSLVPPCMAPGLDAILKF